MSRSALLRNVPEAKMRSALGYGFVDEESAEAQAFVERAMRARTGPRGAAALAALEKSVDGVLDGPPLTERLRKTSVPLLLLGGSDDPLVPFEETAEIRTARPDAKARALAGQGHYPMLEDPGRLATTLREFLATVPA
jgi:pimeloyl-ACP methyl ester carboxylesterase